MDIFENFITRFKANSETILPKKEEIQSLKLTKNLILPIEYIEFICSYGDVWTPDILEIIVDNEISMNDLQKFWTVERILEDLSVGWSSKYSDGIFPFANDCSDNVFFFRFNDESNAEVFFYDFDFEEEEFVADSFMGFMKQFVELP